MAYVGVKVIHKTLRAAMDYYGDTAHDFAKVTDTTDEKNKQYIYCDHCTFEVAHKEWAYTRRKAKYNLEDTDRNVLGYHLYQSFKPGEVTPEEAHELGKEYAERLFGGKYQYIVTTHLDTNCIHNHIAFCSVSYTDHRKYKYEKDQTLREWRRVSDEVCKAHNFSLNNTRNRKTTYKDTKKRSKKVSNREQLRSDIDEVLQFADTFNEFLEEMSKRGYEIKKEGKYITMKQKKWERFARLTQKTLGEDYTEDAIRERIITKRPSIPKRMRYGKKKITLIIDIDTNIKCQTSDAYKNWAKIHNIQEASKALNFLIEHDVGTYDELDEKINSLQNEKRQSIKNLQEMDKDLHDLKSKLALLNDFNDVKKYIIEYNNLSGKEKRQYKEKHYNEFQRFEILKRRIDVEYPNNKIPSAKKMQREFDELIKKRQSVYEHCHSVDEDIDTYSTIKQNIYTFMHRENQQEKNNEQTQEQSKKYTQDL